MASHDSTHNHSRAPAGLPIHHSLPGARNVIWLNFQGMVIQGTLWNTQFGSQRWTARSFSLDNDFINFSPAERTAVSSIWSRVAEDYAPFRVDVTTERPAVLSPTVAVALITRITSSEGRMMPAGNIAGGMAYINVFGSSLYPS